jgi:hypothetical protein
VPPDAAVDPLLIARATLQWLRQNADTACVVSVESTPTADVSTLSTLTTHADPPHDDRPSDVARIVVNPGVLMTLGMVHGYPRLPLKPGLSVAEGQRAWRTFTRSSGQDGLGLAAAAARVAWGDDPMVQDLLFVESTGRRGDAVAADVTAGCGPDSRPTPARVPLVHDADRIEHLAARRRGDT